MSIRLYGQIENFVISNLLSQTLSGPYMEEVPKGG